MTESAARFYMSAEKRNLPMKGGRRDREGIGVTTEGNMLSSLARLEVLSAGICLSYAYFELKPRLRSQEGPFWESKG